MMIRISVWGTGFQVRASSERPSRDRVILGSGERVGSGSFRVHVSGVGFWFLRMVARNPSNDSETKLRRHNKSQPTIFQY